MSSANSSNATVKYTTVLPRDCVNELKRLAEKKVISSINHGIRLAVDSYITQMKQQEYELAMQAAGADNAFIKRTLDAQEAFTHSDEDGIEEW